MLIVAGTFEVEPGRRDEFIAGRAEMMQISRAEPGCQAYVFSADPLEPGRVVLYERWDDEASLAAHLTALRARAAAAPPPADPVPVISSAIMKYEISGSAPLG